MKLNNYIIEADKINPPHIILEIDKYEVPFKIRFMWFLEDHRKKIIFIILSIIAGIIIAVISLADNTTQYNCLNYGSNTLASEIDIKCLQEMWENCGCINKVSQSIPDNYKGWWNNSPQGGVTIRCTPGMNPELCGAGSFQEIRTNFCKCDLNYKGY